MLSESWRPHHRITCICGTLEEEKALEGERELDIFQLHRLLNNPKSFNL